MGSWDLPSFLLTFLLQSRRQMGAGAGGREDGLTQSPHFIGDTAPHCALVSFMSLHDMEAAWGQGPDSLGSLLGPRAPVGVQFRFAEQRENPGVGKRTDLPKTVQPVNSKSWPRNFIFWLQILWLFHDLKKKKRLWFGSLNYLGALICIKDTVYIYWILFFRYINYLFHWTT